MLSKGKNMRISDFVININEQADNTLNEFISTLRVKLFKDLLKLFLSNKKNEYKEKIKAAISRILGRRPQLIKETKQATSRISVTTNKDTVKILQTTLGESLKVNKNSSIKMLVENKKDYEVGETAKTAEKLNPIIREVFTVTNLRKILPKTTSVRILDIINAIEKDVENRAVTLTAAEKNVVTQKTGLASEDLLLNALIRNPKLIGATKIVEENTEKHPHGKSGFPDLLVAAVVNGIEVKIPIDAKGKTIRSTERTDRMLAKEIKINKEKSVGLQKIIDNANTGNLNAAEVRHLMFFYNIYPKNHFYYIVDRKSGTDKFVKINEEKFRDEDENATERFNTFTFRFDRVGKNYRIFGDGFYLFSIDVRGTDLYKQAEAEPSKKEEKNV